MRRFTLFALVAALSAVLAQSAFAAGGSYTFDGGTAFQRAQVRQALDASSFSWGLIPATIAVHIGPYSDSYSTYGNVYLDASLLDAGEFSWGVVQHEFGHQVDFFLLDDAKRSVLQPLLGGEDWCYTTPGLAHSDHACERFASELAWAYWPSLQNSMRPTSSNDEAGRLPAAQFRSLLAQLIGAPSTLTSTATKAFAPKTKQPKKKQPKKKR